MIEKPHISTIKAKSAVRLAFAEFRETVCRVMDIVGLGERVRFERQLEDLDYLYDDIMRRMDESREPATEGRQKVTPEKTRGGG